MPPKVMAPAVAEWLIDAFPFHTTVPPHVAFVAMTRAVFFAESAARVPVAVLVVDLKLNVRVVERGVEKKSEPAPVNFSEKSSPAESTLLLIVSVASAFRLTALKPSKGCARFQLFWLMVWSEAP